MWQNIWHLGESFLNSLVMFADGIFPLFSKFSHFTMVTGFINHSICLKSDVLSSMCDFPQKSVLLWNACPQNVRVIKCSLQFTISKWAKMTIPHSYQSPRQHKGSNFPWKQESPFKLISFLKRTTSISIQTNSFCNIIKKVQGEKLPYVTLPNKYTNIIKTQRETLLKRNNYLAREDDLYTMGIIARGNTTYPILTDIFSGNGVVVDEVRGGVKTLRT